MASKTKDRDNYLKQYPETKKWLNECMICHTIGYKPNMPDKIYPGFLAKNIKRFFSPLAINEINICKDCAKHWHNEDD